MSGTVPIINGPITGMMKVKDRPVFFLKLNNSPSWNLVVKGDARKDDREAGRNSIVWSSKIMKHTNNKLVNTKLMDSNEILHFTNSARSFFTNTQSEEYIQSVEAAQANIFEWVKMPFVQGLSDADFLEQKRDKFDVAQELILKFMSEDIWRELGVVVAADIFNGNSDRFDISNGKWINRGNIMFVAGGDTSVIGLDAYDPNSQMSNMESNALYKELDILRHAGLQQEFAMKCTLGVGTQFKDKLYNDKKYLGKALAIPAGDTVILVQENDLETLFTPYATVFAEGLQRGSMKLKTYLQRKHNQYYAPQRPQMAPRSLQPATPQRPQSPPRGIQPAPPPRPASKPFVRGAVPQMIWQANKAMPEGVKARMGYLGW